jgi:DNA-binding NtrC family response regulator
VARVRTRTDDGGDRAPDRVHALAYVLSFDDLLRDDAWLAVLPERGAIEIGRGDGAARAALSGDRLDVPDGWASAAHARVGLEGEKATITDLGSRNGTWVSGERVTDRTLQDGDVVEIGHCLFVYRRVERAHAELVAEGRDANMLGRTPTLCAEAARMLSDLRRVARSRDSVLVLGETGSGKESTAETIHRLSKRSGPLVAVDAGAVPDNLFESTFFGHKKGAFTGADAARIGCIAQAHGGTLFLDEVGNLSAAAQAKLLRVIETGLVTPLGATEPIEVDVRWVAATNRDLYDAVDSSGSSFRADLLRRLAGYVARLPPLRARREDLGTITAFVLREAGVTKASITTTAARRLFTGALPGNVRQLRSALRSAALLAGTDAIDVAHLPAELAGAGPADSAPPAGAAARAPARRGSTLPPPFLRPSAKDVEEAIERSSGNVVHAAALLGTHPRQVYRWIERYGIDLTRYR